MNHYFFCGIGGIGMSALAQMLAARGDMVTGSDREAGPTTILLEQKEIHVFIGQRAENIADTCTTLIYSDAVAEDHPERAAARAKGIPELSYFQMLGLVSDGYRSVAVAGTHGKTTTTGMLTKILHDTGAEPTAIIGSIVKDFGSNYVPGTSNLFVVEACEYRDHLLELAPEVLVITNLEWDHTDYFPSLGAMQKTFRTAIERVPKHGFIVTDPSIPNIQPLLEGIAATVVDYTAEPSYELLLPGEFNKNNARAAAAAARIVFPTITSSDISASLQTFHGTWRRFEYKGTIQNDIVVYDDYAHHPTAVSETLCALREKNNAAGRAGRIIAAFHPHLFSRTRDLIDQFAQAFTGADEVIIAPIYAAREIDDGTVSASILAERISAEGVHAQAANSLDEVRTVLQNIMLPGDTIITMGAGDIYKVADRLVKEG